MELAAAAADAAAGAPGAATTIHQSQPPPTGPLRRHGSPHLRRTFISLPCAAAEDPSRTKSSPQALKFFFEGKPPRQQIPMCRPLRRFRSRRAPSCSAFCFKFRTLGHVHSPIFIFLFFFSFLFFPFSFLVSFTLHFHFFNPNRLQILFKLRIFKI
jgi:hypothetical protein